MRPVERHRHFAEDGTGLGQHGNYAVALDDLQPTFDQDEQMSGFPTLADDEVPPPDMCRVVPPVQ